MERCIFDRDIDCRHFIDDEYRCVIFMQKCEIIKSKYKTEIGINTFDEITSLIFKKTEKGGIDD